LFFVYMSALLFAGYEGRPARGRSGASRSRRTRESVTPRRSRIAAGLAEMTQPPKSILVVSLRYSVTCCSRRR
jgi:hypothetical protein